LVDNFDLGGNEMIPKASIVTNYKYSGPDERLDIIFTYFTNFIGIVDGYTERSLVKEASIEGISMVIPDQISEFKK
jgi:hypothetical protein